MTEHMDRTVAHLRLGAPVQFQDRSEGSIAAIEVDEDWEVLNITVKRGFLRWISSVKLPFAASPHWSDAFVRFDCTSRQAFAREVPPVAAPARPLSPATPLSIAGATLEGLLVEPGRRFATGVIIQRGWTKSRAPVADLSFEGKILHIATHGDDLRPYLSDGELEPLVRETLATARALTGEERRTVRISVTNGEIRAEGNVFTRSTKQALEHALSRLAGAALIHLEVIDDHELELAIGQALERASFTHNAQVYARSALGDVTLYGEAPSSQTADDIVRTVSRVPGVRSVRSLLMTGRQTAALS